jgi:hypothetical protein
MNERLRELARQAGFKNWGYDEELERFAELVRDDEREACAKLCDEWFAGTAAVDIRARGQQ